MAGELIGCCMRLCYDPHSQYLTDHYRLGAQLGKGAFGEVRAARLRLKSHVYSKRVVGKDKDWEQKRADTADPSSPGRTSFDSAQTAATPQNEQRRANQDKHHYAQGVLDWPFACKIIKKSKVDVKGIMREIKVLDLCQHQHCLLLVEHFEDSKEICMIMGRCYGDVEVVHKKTEKQGIDVTRVHKWINQLIDALAFVHSRRIVHRDVKLPNMLLTSENPDCDIVLGDFGFGEDCAQLASTPNDICGTPLMLAPETFDGRPQQCPTDVWATGCCLYELITIEHPFSNSKVQRKVKTGLEGGEVEEMTMSVRIKRQKPGDIEIMDAKQSETQKKSDGRKGKKGAGLRNRKDFHNVAKRFSTNPRFIERFEELAVAVTSNAIQIDTSHSRFHEKPELNIKELVLKLLTRDVTQRPTADLIAGKEYAANAPAPSPAAKPAK